MKSGRRKPVKARRRPALASGRARRSPEAAADPATQLRRERDEALEQQKATADVLRVIASSPADLLPVFKAIVQSAAGLCQAANASLYRVDGSNLRHVANYGRVSTLNMGEARPIRRGSLSGSAIVGRKVVHVRDALAVAATKFPDSRAAIEREKIRSSLAVPLLRGKATYGVIVVRRDVVQPFSSREIELLKTFADQAVIAIENVNLLGELRQRTDDLTESLEQQTATSEVLKVISSTPGELEPVFQAMLENATRICEASYGMLFRVEGDGVTRPAAMLGVPPAFADYWQQSRRPGPRTALGRIIERRQTIHIADVTQDPAYLEGEPVFVAAVNLGRFRTILSVPMLKDNELVGIFAIYRQEVRPFTDKQIELVTNFAAQAVIAIENTRLLNELRQRTGDLTESLEQQTATSEVLNVISSSLSDAQPVFDAIVQSGMRLFPDAAVFIALPENGMIKAAAMAEKDPVRAAVWRQRFPFPLSREYLHGVAILDRALVDVPDVRKAPPELAVGAKNFLASGYRAVTIVPMMRGDAAIGALSVVRLVPGPLPDKQIAVLKNFAAQAVIAIENTRLLSELRQRTGDLTESLEQQTATSEVLKVISSSPGALQPVFQAMLENATRICGAKFGALSLYDQGTFTNVAVHNVPEGFAQMALQEPFRPHPKSGLARLAATNQIVQTEDLRAQPPYLEGDPAVVAISDVAGARTILNVPMLKEGMLVGAMSIFRQEVKCFTDKQIALVENFAAQAVIAIENTRLLNELRQRTDDLTESLEQQTATAEVLKVISSSPGDLQPVFQAVLENATRICEAKFGNLFLTENADFRAVAVHGDPAYEDYWRRDPVLVIRDDPSLPAARMASTRQVLHIPDMSKDQSYLNGNFRIVALVKRAGARTFLAVPMLKDGVLIGAIMIYRQEVRPFTDKQIELVQNFAAQAVIAIENTRLLNELRQRTDDLTESLEQQTATAEVLKVISSSPGELEPVFNAMLENATRICGASFGNLLLYERDVFRHVALHNAPPRWVAEQLRDPVPPRHAARFLYRVADTKQIAHIADIAAENPDEPIARIAGARTLLIVPMLKESELIGVFGIFRQEVRPFTDKQIELVQNFAAQAVIAIENARLLSELRQRTDDLTESLEQQTATSEVLKVISSSPGALQPVFDTMLAKATELCGAAYGSLWLSDGDGYRHVALNGSLPPAYTQHQRDGTLYRPSPDVPIARAASTRRPVQVDDLRLDPSYLAGDPIPVSGVKVGGIRTLVAVPMLKESELVGIIVIYRQEVRPFSDKQIELVQNFAAQAVIAIENARLLNELRQRTGDLTESLEQQTATSEVLKVISSSPGDLEPVFNAMLENAVRICEAKFGNLALYDGHEMRMAAMHNAPQAFAELRRRDPVMPRGSVMARILESKRMIHIADLTAEEPSASSALVKVAGARTAVGVPMLKENELVGAIVIYRTESRAFTDKQIALLTNFAAQAVIAIENARLLKELHQRTDDLSESLQQQTATGEILTSISGSMTDTKPVFDAIVRNLMRLFGTRFAVVQLLHDGIIQMAATDREAVEFDKLMKHYPRPLDKNTIGGQAMLSKQVVQVAPVLGNSVVPPATQEIAEMFGIDSFIFAPMMRGDKVVGAVGTGRREPKKFDSKQVALIKGFADQAVIAIENATLFNELQKRTDDLSESLQQQTATADVLKVISRSTFDLQTVLKTLVESAAQLCDADKTQILRPTGEGNGYYSAASHGHTLEYDAHMRTLSFPPGKGSVVGRVQLENKSVQVHDVLADPEYTAFETQRLGGYRTHLGVPLLREGSLIGVLVVSRVTVRPFEPKHVELIETFADQAVIAIENVRLFDEVQQRTEDLAESLQQQTATADVLKVISRSTFDLQVVLDTLTESAARLCEADMSGITRDDGSGYRHVTNYGYPQDWVEFNKTIRMQAERGSVVGRVLLEGKAVQVADVLADPEYTYHVPAKKAGYRTFLGVPLLREGNPIGVLTLARRTIAPFTDKQIELVSTFADQAVIAIENVRLFDEVQARTDDLAESLQQQTATADVLKVISRSTFDLQTVLDTLLKSAAHLCDADQGTITQRKGEVFYRSVVYGFSAEFLEYVKDLPVEASRKTGTGRALLEGRVIHIPDVHHDPDFDWPEAERLGGFCTMLGVPMMREGVPVGVLTLTRSEVRPFTDKQIELVATFADQAAIAIENVRLFDEIQDKSRQLEVASRHKSQFLANMSHELRTPLNAILGYTELIMDGVYGDTPDKMRATLERVQRNGRHLLGLINDVLDLSKIEAGQLTLSLGDYSIRQVVHDVYGAVESLAANKHIGLKVEMPNELPQGRGDERRLTQVLLNLVGNAIKFTDEGEVVIAASAANGAFTVAVRDTGPGISKSDQGKIFEEFQQADNSMTKSKGGTGLGLAIARRIMEMHGGRLWVESEVGSGSTFIFTLPVEIEQQARQA